MTLEEAIEYTLSCGKGASILSKLFSASKKPAAWDVEVTRDALLPEEDVLFSISTLTKVGSTGGSITGLLTITDRRILVCRGESSQSICIEMPIDTIESMSVEDYDLFVELHIIGRRDSFTFSENPKFIELAKKTLDTLIYNQSQKAAFVETQPSSNETDTIQVLKSYKELLDAGVITQEEFDAKKKQLLNL